ncbi:MAG: hypothetical protein ACK59J_03675 [Pseudanabaena sp.]
MNTKVLQTKVFKRIVYMASAIVPITRLRSPKSYNPTLVISRL